LSWNPDLFDFQITIHGYWPNTQGPRDDSFNLGENPQYIVTFSEQAIKQKPTLWILLSRHVTKQEQEGTTITDFLTVHIYKNDQNKERIWINRKSNCLLNGAYTNNPHVLVRYDLSKPSDKVVSLVLSQHKKSNDLGYTLSCYCTTNFTLGRPAKELPYKVELKSAWTRETAGGPPGSASFYNNPMWSFEVPAQGANIHIKCSTIKHIPLNVMVVRAKQKGLRVKKLGEEPVVDTGNYRNGFTATKRSCLKTGAYIIIASTFEPQQLGMFYLTVTTSIPLRIDNIE